MKIRKILGGGMRQSGYLAACGLYALDNNIQKLQQDHIRAREISNLLEKLYFVEEGFALLKPISLFLKIKINFPQKILLIL